MNTITVEESKIIPAAAKTVYAAIADYRVGHQAILPQPAFRELLVLAGGYGAGTRIEVHVRIWGQSYYFNQVVEEPEPGLVLVEREINTGQKTTFTLEPLSDNRTRVTISSVNQLSKGVRGFLERISQPRLIGNLFKTELQNLADYVTDNEIVMHGA